MAEVGERWDDTALIGEVPGAGTAGITPEVGDEGSSRWIALQRSDPLLSARRAILAGVP